MSKKWINQGDALPFTVARAVTNGQVIVIGGLSGIADRTSAANEENTLHRTGQWELPKVTGALAVGADYKVDISDLDDITHSIAAVSSTVVVVGIVTRAAASADTTVDVVLV